MIILPKSSNLSYSQNKIRYVRDSTQDNSILKTEIGNKTLKTYFHFNDTNNKLANILVRVANKIAHFFGAKTISQDNLSNCLRHANAQLNTKLNFTLLELQELLVSSFIFE